MNIPVVTAIGRGPTSLSAFDAALIASGIGNYNILVLSSVIPPGATVILEPEPAEPGGGWGDRLYVVMAEERSELPGAEVWAALGWVQDETGRGLFVEHHGPSEHYVREQVNLSLRGLLANRREDFGAQQIAVAGADHQGEPVCALVAAIYQPQAW